MKLEIFIAFTAISYIWLFCSVWKSHEKIKRIWRETTDYERRSLIVGFVLLALLPFISEHPSQSSYIPMALTEMIKVVSGALFALGVLAFSKKGHELSSEEEQQQTKES